MTANSTTETLLKAMRYVAKSIEGNDDATNGLAYAEPIYGALGLAQYLRAAIAKAER